MAIGYRKSNGNDRGDHNTMPRQAERALDVDKEQSSTPVVLLVEDEVLLRLLAVETLTEAGFKVLDAGHGDDAAALIRSQAKIDLLITDIKIPGVNGFDLAEIALEERPGIKVLLATGYSNEPLPEEIAKAGVGVLYKPFDVSRLAELARSLI